MRSPFGSARRRRAKTRNDARAWQVWSTNAGPSDDTEGRYELTPIRGNRLTPNPAGSGASAAAAAILTT
jgi:hypothetical protein